MKHLVAILVLVLVVPIAVLGYGYWFGQTHGALMTSVTDVSDRDHSRSIVPARVVFLDRDARPLAEARSDERYGTIYLSWPNAYACHDVEMRAPFSSDARREWDACFARQSRWLPSWIRRADTATVELDGCTARGLPLALSEYPDTWWLWWVPLPHVGGKPYTTFSVRIDLDRRSACGPGNR